MYVQKSKNYTNLISINELKNHLRIDESDSSYDSELTKLIKTSISLAERHCNTDIALTTCVLTDNDISAFRYTIYEPNITINGITGSTITDSRNITSSVITGYTIEKNHTNTVIVFDSFLNVDKITISYSCGYTAGTIPFEIVQAVKVKCAELFDIDRNGYTSNVKQSFLFERLLSAHTNYNA